jgi:hypothetical protein
MSVDLSTRKLVNEKLSYAAIDRADKAEATVGEAMAAVRQNDRNGKENAYSRG